MSFVTYFLRYGRYAMWRIVRTDPAYCRDKFALWPLADVRVLSYSRAEIQVSGHFQGFCPLFWSLKIPWEDRCFWYPLCRKGRAFHGFWKAVALCGIWCFANWIWAVFTWDFAADVFIAVFSVCTAYITALVAKKLNFVFSAERRVWRALSKALFRRKSGTT